MKFPKTLTTNCFFKGVIMTGFGVFFFLKSKLIPPLCYSRNTIIPSSLLISNHTQIIVTSIERYVCIKSKHFVYPVLKLFSLLRVCKHQSSSFMENCLISSLEGSCDPRGFINGGHGFTQLNKLNEVSKTSAFFPACFCVAARMD